MTDVQNNGLTNSEDIKIHNTRAQSRKETDSVERWQMEQNKIERTKNESDKGEVSIQVYSVVKNSNKINKEAEVKKVSEKVKSIKTKTENSKLTTMAKNFEADDLNLNENNPSDLSTLIRLLTIKIGKEEEYNNKANVTVDSFSKRVPNFDGENITVEHWLENFEQNANAYDLNEKQKYVHARNKIVGTAKLFLDTATVSD